MGNRVKTTGCDLTLCDTPRDISLLSSHTRTTETGRNDSFSLSLHSLKTYVVLSLDRFNPLRTELSFYEDRLKKFPDSFVIYLINDSMIHRDRNYKEILFDFGD